MNLEKQKSYSNYDQTETVVEIFERRVLNTPAKIILEFNDQRFTYHELNEKANQLAHFLKANGVQYQTMVGICLHQSEERLIAMLAILKVGGIYVPLDTSYPASRFQLIFEDTQMPFLITENSIHENIQNYSGQRLILDHPKSIGSIKQQPKENTPRINKSNDAAYIIYTSGSTGMPKGCC